MLYQNATMLPIDDAGYSSILKRHIFLNLTLYNIILLLT